MKRDPATFVLLAAFCAGVCSAAPAAPVAPTVAPEADPAVLAALDKAGHAFTPEVKAAFLASRKADALKELAAHGIRLPADFLAWVDGDPVVAATVYGTRHGSPAQALYVLRSLEIDLGSARLRKYAQLGLAAARLHGPAVRLDAKESESFSLADRPLFKVVIPPSPLVKVDTHPKDRPLDVNDHIINFLEEEETVAKGADGQEITVVKPRNPVLTAGQLVSSLKLQAAFNAYMARKSPGFAPIDCGDDKIHHHVEPIWVDPYSARLHRASEVFAGAYVAKGRLAERNDAPPSPTQWLAYQIGNAENPARAADLDRPWPILMQLVVAKVPLREAEYVWGEKARGLDPLRYIDYIESVAQTTPNLIMLAKLQPFDFPYNSYPGKRLHGGVCGSHAHTNMVGGWSMGRSMMGCSAPGHAFPGELYKDAKSGLFHFTGGDASTAYYLGAGAPEGAGPDQSKMNSTCWAVNLGLARLVDAQLAWTLEQSLPPQVRARHGGALLGSAVAINPYNPGLIRAAQANIASPREQVAFHAALRAALTDAAKKPGCPDKGFREEFDRALNANLARLPVPTDAADTAAVADYVAGQDDAVWAKYQAAKDGLPALKQRLAKDLEAHLGGARTAADASLLANRIMAVGGILPDSASKTTWSEALLAILAGKEYSPPNAVAAADPCLRAAHTVHAQGAGIPAAQAEVEAQLKAAINGTRTARGSALLSEKIIAVGKLLPESAPKGPTPRSAWCQLLLGILRGHEFYAPSPATPGQQAVDPCITAIYSLEKTHQAERERLVKDYQAAVAANRGEEAATALSLRLRTLHEAIGDPAERNAFDDAILGALTGHHFFHPDMHKPSVMKLDPALRILAYKASKTEFFTGLNASMANGQSPESSAALGEYIVFLWAQLMWKVPQQLALAEEIKAVVRGHELYAPDPAKPSDVRYESLLNNIYHHYLGWDNSRPRYGSGVPVGEEDRKSCEAWLQKTLAAPRTSESCAAMRTLLDCLAKRMTDPERKAWGEKLADIVRGHEYFEAADAAGVKSLKPDPAAAYVHQLAGQPMPAAPK